MSLHDRYIKNMFQSLQFQLPSNRTFQWHNSPIGLLNSNLKKLYFGKINLRGFLLH